MDIQKNTRAYPPRDRYTPLINHPGFNDEIERLRPDNRSAVYKASKKRGKIIATIISLLFFVIPGIFFILLTIFSPQPNISAGLLIRIYLFFVGLAMTWEGIRKVRAAIKQ